MRVLSEYKAEQFLAREGFPIVDHVLVQTLAQAENAAKKYKNHIVLKIASDTLLHKSDMNAVRLDVHPDALTATFHDLQKIKTEKHGIIIQKHITGKQLIIGLKKDPTFGHVILVGIGGIYTEVIHDVSMRVTPISNHDALTMLQELKSYKILKGYRGEKINIQQLIDIIVHVSALATKYPTIKELDINPLIINEKDAHIVDARIIFDE